MNNWLQNRRLLPSLLIGGLAMIFFLAALWAGTVLYFLAQSDAANRIRWVADTINYQFLQARRAEKDFMLRDLRNPEFFEKGISKHLSKYQDLMAAIPADLEALTGLASGREKELAAQIPAALAAYAEAFSKLVAAYRERGHKDWGVEGEWRKAVHDLEGDLPQLKDLSLDVGLLQVRRNEKDYLLRGDDKYVEAVYAGLKKLAARLQASRDQAVAKRLQEDLNAYEQSFRKYLAIEASIGKTEEAGLQGEMRQAAHQIEPLLEGISKQAVLDSEATRQKLTSSSVIALLIGIGLAALFFYFFARSVANPIKRLSEAAESVGGGDLRIRMNFESENELGTLARGFNQMLAALSALIDQAQKASIQTTTSVTEIAATSKQQQATATETAATTTEIGATSREIVATSRDLLRTMSEVSSATEQAATLADSGQLGLTRMEETMHQVIGAAELVNAKLAILNEKAGNITQVVTTIVKVADQTNLLSLNAAIEAEKAGEYGRGFAVVATEVRRLADQTAVATYDIEQMVREIQSAVSAGVMGMDKFSEEVRRGMAEVQLVGEQLSQIIQQTQALAPRVSMVNEGMQAQSSGAEQISQALVQLAEATGQTVESLRQTSFAIDELSLVANGLRTGVSRFQV